MDAAISAWDYIALGPVTVTRRVPPFLPNLRSPTEVMMRLIYRSMGSHRLQSRDTHSIMTETFSERSKQEEAKLTELTACDRFLSVVGPKKETTKISIKRV